MAFCLLIVLSRIYSDQRAKKTYLDEISTATQFISEVFNYGMEAGRFREFNIQAISSILISSRNFLAQVSIVNPAELNHYEKIQSDIFSELIKLIPFKY